MGELQLLIKRFFEQSVCEIVIHCVVYQESQVLADIYSDWMYHHSWTTCKGSSKPPLCCVSLLRFQAFDGQEFIRNAVKTRP